MDLDFDKWSGNRNKGGSLTVSKDDLEVSISYLNKLNQKEHTQLVVGGDESNLMIGGGKGVYICTVTVGDHEHYFNLINSKQVETDDEIEVVTGGQAGLFPPKIVVDYDTTVEALTYYLRHQAMNPDLVWEEDI